MISCIVIMYLVVGFWVATLLVLLPRDNIHTVYDGSEFLVNWLLWPIPLVFLMSTWPLAIFKHFILLLDYWVRVLRRV